MLIHMHKNVNFLRLLNQGIDYIFILFLVLN
jgi:hypothetical protein